MLPSGCAMASSRRAFGNSVGGHGSAMRHASSELMPWATGQHAREPTLPASGVHSETDPGNPRLPPRLGDDSATIRRASLVVNVPVGEERQPMRPSRGQAVLAAGQLLLRLPALLRSDLHKLPGEPQAQPPLSLHGPKRIYSEPALTTASASRLTFPNQLAFIRSPAWAFSTPLRLVNWMPSSVWVWGISVFAQKR